MTTHDCATGCGRPATAVLCNNGRQSCAALLEDALATLGVWTKAPEPLTAWCDLATREIRGRWHGERPSSVFDTAGGHDAAGKTKGLAAELDIQRSRQGRRGSQNGPRLAPDSKVWAPQKGLDRVERDLALAVAHWIGLLRSVNVSAPRAVTTGHVLARGCTWLLWHVQDILKHPEAGSAFVAFTRAAKAVERAIDLPPERVYVGPCWRWVDQPSNMPAGAFGPLFAVECQSDLYADLAETVVTCQQCLNVVEIAERRAWLMDHVEDELGTRTECLRAVAMLGLEVSESAFKSWTQRQQLPAHGYVVSGGRKAGLYRVGDVIRLAVRLPEEKRGGSRKVSA